MIIKTGSENPTKVEALKEVMKDYFPDSTVIGIAVAVPRIVGCQPKSMSDTLCGADYRAKQAFESGGCDLGIGLESGMIGCSKFTKSGYLNALFCSIFDGKNFHIGMSSAFEMPKDTIEIVLEDPTIDLSEALFRAEYTKEERIGYGKGFIHVLTKGRVTRQDFVIQAVQMAMIHLENSEWYLA